MYRNAFIIAGWLLVALASCTVEEIEELDFFTVETREAKREDNDLLGRVRLEGRIYPDPNPVVPEIEDYGFFWSNDRDALLDQLPEVEKIPLGAYNLDCDTCFVKFSPSMQSGVIYYYQAYAQSGPRLMLGEIRSVSFSVFTQLELLERRNDSLTLRATILNLDDLDAFVQDFGILIDQDPDQLSLDNAAHVMSFGAIDKDTTYRYDFGRVEFNTTYYARTYYVTDVPMYGSTIELQITDGWTRLDSLPNTLYEAAGVGWNNRGFGYVCGGQETIMGSFVDRVYRFDPVTSDGMGSWMETMGVNGGLREAVALIWQEELLYGHGRQNGLGFEWFIYPNLFPALQYSTGSYDLLSDAYDAVGFVLNDKVYFGTGTFVNGTYTNEFLEMSMENDSVVIRTMASVPVMVNNVIDDTLGRSGALTFSWEGEHYVAGGRGPNFQYADIQRFIPPTATNPQGGWEVIDHELPGGGRDEGVAVSLGDRAFVGFGFRSNGGGYLKDFWEYRPDTPEKWIPTEPFPGLPREKAFAFSLNGSVYVGGGFRNRVDITDSIIIRPQSFQDFWRYTPVEND